MLTSERYVTGGATLWRYIARAAVVARLDSLNAILRAEDATKNEVEKSEEANSQPAVARQAPMACEKAPPMPLLNDSSTPSGRSFLGRRGAVGLDERGKELIRMKIERLEACKSIVEREHAMHGGGGGGSGGGGAGGGGR